MSEKRRYESTARRGAVTLERTRKSRRRRTTSADIVEEERRDKQQHQQQQLQQQQQQQQQHGQEGREGGLQCGAAPSDTSSYSEKLLNSGPVEDREEENISAYSEDCKMKEEEDEEESLYQRDIQGRAQLEMEERKAHLEVSL